MTANRGVLFDGGRLHGRVKSMSCWALSAVSVIQYAVSRTPESLIFVAIRHSHLQCLVPGRKTGDATAQLDFSHASQSINDDRTLAVVGKTEESSTVVKGQRIPLLTRLNESHPIMRAAFDGMPRPGCCEPVNRMVI
nr:hypothetical protein CFP56_73945 [Quercus suber]